MSTTINPFDHHIKIYPLSKYYIEPVGTKRDLYMGGGTELVNITGYKPMDVNTYTNAPLPYVILSDEQGNQPTDIQIPNPIIPIQWAISSKQLGIDNIESVVRIIKNQVDEIDDRSFRLRSNWAGGSTMDSSDVDCLNQQVIKVQTELAKLRKMVDHVHDVLFSVSFEPNKKHIHLVHLFA
jgi:hypothetical protein